jgi:hypothetical protein
LSEEISWQSFLLGRGGRPGGDSLPSTRALLHIRIVALRVGAVIPGSGVLRRWLDSLPAFDIYRRLGRNGYGRWRIVIGGKVIRRKVGARIVRTRIVVRTGVIPRHEQEWVDDNSDAHIAMPAIPDVSAMSAPCHDQATHASDEQS